jgi:hypothetical protein
MCKLLGVVGIMGIALLILGIRQGERTEMRYDLESQKFDQAWSEMQIESEQVKNKIENTASVSQEIIIDALGTARQKRDARSEAQQLVMPAKKSKEQLASEYKIAELERELAAMKKRDSKFNDEIVEWGNTQLKNSDEDVDFDALEKELNSIH